MGARPTKPPSDAGNRQSVFSFYGHHWIDGGRLIMIEHRFSLREKRFMVTWVLEVESSTERRSMRKTQLKFTVINIHFGFHIQRGSQGMYAVQANTGLPF